MTILELELAHFGKFHHKKIKFSRGLNVIYGKNEAGKSTIHAFIRCMLLGMNPEIDGTRNRYYEKYYPWDTSEAGYGGMMRMAVSGHIYRVERSFLKTASFMKLVDETADEDWEGQEAENSLRDLLEGLNETAFDNTVSIAQLKSTTEPGLLTELEKFVSNTSQTKNVRVDMSRARERLEQQADDLRREFAEGAEADLAETEANLKRVSEEKNRLQDREYRMRREQDSLEEQVAFTTRSSEEALLAYDRERDAMRRQYEAARNNWENLPDPESRKKGHFTLFFLLLALMCFAGAWYLYYRTGLQEQLYLYTAAGLATGGIFCLAGMGFAIAAARRTKKRYQAEDALREKLRFQLKESADRFEQFKSQTPVSPEDATREMKSRLTELEEELTQCGKDLEKSRKAYEELSRSVNEIRGQVLKNEGIARELDSVELAMQTLSTVAMRVQETFGSRLCKEAAQILEKLTEGRYDRIQIRKQEISIGTEERMHELKAMSCGTVEQVYFSIRVAAAALLWQKSPLPFLFDDVFSRYDDERLAAAMDLLKDCGHQVIVFSSNTREDEMVDA